MRGGLRKGSTRVLAVPALALAVALVAIGGGAAVAAVGDVDKTFSGDGVATTDFGADDGARAIAIQADGKILTAGTGGPGKDLALARYLPDGSPDLAFSGDGTATLDLGTAGVDVASALALAPGGKIVVAGSTSLPTLDFAVARFNSDGSVDKTFSAPDGFDLVDFAGDDIGRDVAVDSSGRVAVSGVASAGPLSDFAIAVYNADGTPNTTFSTDGKETTDFGGADDARAVAIQVNGKVVAAGAADLTDDFGVARYLTDGTLDPGFSGDGKQTTNLGNTESAAAIEIDGNGRILAAGTMSSVTASNFAVLRYLANGLLDFAFAGDGAQTDLPLPKLGDDVRGVAYQPDGKILAIGASAASASSPGSIELLRLNPSGSVDTKFSSDGRVSTVVAEGEDVAAGKDGRIVAAGGSIPPVGSSTTPDFAVVRYIGVTCNGKETTLVGTQGVDNLKGTKGKDVISTFGDKDIVRGRRSADVICGGDGKDSLSGGKGKDRLYGGKGRDKLFGGKGKDRLRGGPGKDYRKQ